MPFLKLFCFSNLDNAQDVSALEISCFLVDPPTNEPQTNNNGFLTVEEGSNIEIRCHITGGNPISSLSWKCNEQFFNGTDTINGTTIQSQLSIPAKSSYNDKSCYCIVFHPLLEEKQIETKLNIQCKYYIFI